MKTTRVLGFALFIMILILTLIAANFSQLAASAQGATISLRQTTSTPLPGDASVIGSTDGILAMGILITLIIVIPIIIYKRKS
jgi:hypothetical protein